MNSAMSADERRQHWVETLASDTGQVWNWQPELIRLVSFSQDYLALLVGTPIRIRMPPPGPISHPPGRRASASASPSDGSPTSKARPSGAPKAWAMSDTLRQLGLYGLYGVLDADLRPAKRAARLDELLFDGETLLKFSPFAQAAEHLEHPRGTAVIRRVAGLAVARRVLETGEGHMEPSSLAILGGVSEGRVRNLMSQGGRFRSIRAGVHPESARDWLQGRPAFWNSI